MATLQKFLGQKTRGLKKRIPSLARALTIIKAYSPPPLNFDPLVLDDRTSGDKKIGDEDTGGNRDGGGKNKQQSTKSSSGNGEENGDNDVEIDQDLSRKCVGPLALARLYGESCIFTVNFES